MDLSGHSTRQVAGIKSQSMRPAGNIGKTEVAGCVKKKSPLLDPFDFCLSEPRITRAFNPFRIVGTNYENSTSDSWFRGTPIRLWVTREGYSHPNIESRSSPDVFDCYKQRQIRIEKEIHPIRWTVSLIGVTLPAGSSHRRRPKPR
jgi:hypothetical protein